MIPEKALILYSALIVVKVVGYVPIIYIYIYSIFNVSGSI